MAPHSPITENLAEAFCTAIMAFDDWARGGPEPQVFLEGKFLPVSAVAKFVSMSTEPMPEGICDFLCRVIGPGNAPTDFTFAAGGKSLYRACMDLQTRRVGQSDQGRLDPPGRSASDTPNSFDAPLGLDRG
jgi:hypothetical protein